MKYKITAIITAAGSGKRFGRKGGTALPKQFVMLKGKPVILHSMMVFQRSRYIDEIIISADKKYFDMLHDISVKNKVSKLTYIVEGGKTRYESVRNAFMQAVNLKYRLVMIHDAARPNIDSLFVESLIKGFKNCDGLVPAIKIPETVKRAKKGFVKETVNREELYTIQTPQLFTYSSLIASYLKGRRKHDFTDESSLVEASGFKVRIMPGKKENIKITTADDFKILKLLM